MPKDIQYRKLLLIQPFGPLETALRIETGNLLLTKDDEKVDKIPLYSLLAIFIIGRLTVTTQFLRECAACGVAVFFLSESFDTYARCGAETAGNYLLRQRQYTITPDEELMHARTLITHKLHAQQAALAFFGKPPLDLDDIGAVPTRESLLGTEGNISSQYFSCLFESIGWYKRLPQAKPDEINLLMDIGYTMLFNLCDAMLALFGFDTYKGFYHQLFYARKSLACDLMEPWRPLIDSTILLMYRQNVFHKKDFIVKNSSFLFADGFKGRSKYARAFLKCLTSHKGEIYEYIRGYYLFVSKPDRYTFAPPVLDLAQLSISSS